MQAPDEENVLEGHEVTQDPCEASLLFEHVSQNVDDPAQVPHEESQAVHV